MVTKNIKDTKKEPKFISHARAYVTSTFNNTIVTLADSNGRVLIWGSSGASGFKGARKSTPFAATTAVEGVAKKAKERGIASVELYIKGPGPGRDGAIRAFKAAGLNITMIADVTPIPHNGPRPRKRRRV
ncbi:30S ribosomal protein S11 [Candidatus Curtissbacteria bacterium RBG_13_40_7]|uniref:Small ribosomal subunit protein uS11 n=1 Tax=Candidatus Curtissbacteria bacterium RBG_13_40_7 TaxID=1797706 RepID=A0A1F5FX61_9BACT|nr:MAG: 30S ribosomal protein S11 [Candidatus Curtissbacteria bacterium RBG_13_40_7]